MDEIRIAALLEAYGQGMDLKDAALLRSLFAPRATFRFAGAPAFEADPADFIALSLDLLGPPAVVGEGGATSALPFERRSQLVVLLALKRAWVGRHELAAMLWPEQPGRGTRAARS